VHEEWRGIGHGLIQAGSGGGEPQYGGLLSEHLFELTLRGRGMGHIFPVRDST